MALYGLSFTPTFHVWDTANNEDKTGDAANLTIYLIQDGTAVAASGSPAEVDSANCPGIYKITLTAAEMSYNHITVCGKSSTADVVVIPAFIQTDRNYLNLIQDKTH